MPHAALILVFCLVPLLAQGQDTTPGKVESNGHTLTVWKQSPAKPPAKISQLHRRAWSSIADFDLQVASEELSLMDGLVARHVIVWRSCCLTGSVASSHVTGDRFIHLLLKRVAQV